MGLEVNKQEDNHTLIGISEVSSCYTCSHPSGVSFLWNLSRPEDMQHLKTTGTPSNTGAPQHHAVSNPYCGCSSSTWPTTSSLKSLLLEAESYSYVSSGCPSEHPNMRSYSIFSLIGTHKEQRALHLPLLSSS